jgi:hypothetical protein
MSETLDNDTLQRLREEHIITENEIAIQHGDKIVAENVITKDRRIIHVPQRLMENSRRILKG